MIVVTAPTGLIGQKVLARLLDADAKVRLIVRDPSKLTAEVRERVEIVQGSHSDAEVVNRAFEGAETVFWLVAAGPREESLEAAFVDFTRPGAKAMKTHGIKRVVNISGLGRDTSFADKAGHATASHAKDDLIAETGVALRTLTMPSFMDNIAQQAGPIKEHGMFFSPIDGDLELPFCSTRDIAAVAARWLLDDSWTGQEDVAVLGPENISFNRMAQIMSDVLGKSVRFQQTSFDAFKEQLQQHGFNEPMAQGLTDLMYAKNHGLDLGVERTDANTTPTTFRQWCDDVLVPTLRTS
ncbi:NmrA family NAD(P)-binding protein [Burkholderia metallica]|uniref:NmrA family NAD(P)-binding protein n=1 Tax=Burkholderia metallica TaxID=488729 RepID=UPI0015771191|nr:NAD(P)H-binding protein [Burkholderia metallica]NTZ04958.1 NAD-dependent epimerase/dehydratase family protein [Burkholderia metallica]